MPMPYPCGGPFESKYMGEGSRAQVPLRLTDEFIAATTYVVGTVERNLGYQAEQKFAAGERWVRAKEKGEYVWLSIAGAATPVGMGGLIADLIERGLVDAIVSTGANVYHDLHFACGLPVRHRWMMMTCVRTGRRGSIRNSSTTRTRSSCKIW